LPSILVFSSSPRASCTESSILVRTQHGTSNPQQVSSIPRLLYNTCVDPSASTTEIQAAYQTLICKTELANYHVSYHRICQFRRIGQLACKLAYSTIFMKSTILVIIPLVFWSTLHWFDLQLGVAVGITVRKLSSLSVSPKAKLTVTAGQNLTDY
jgi:hypothetical protein